MQKPDDYIAYSGAQLRFLKLTYAYARQEHDGEVFKFITSEEPSVHRFMHDGDPDKKKEFIVHPVEVAAMMPTAFLKAAALIHDVFESHVEKLWGKTPLPAFEHAAIEAKRQDIKEYFEQHGFPLNQEIDGHYTVNDVVTFADHMTQRRSKYNDPAKVGEYFELLDPFQKAQITQTDKESPYYHRFLQYMLYVKENLVDFARATNDVSIITLKTGDIIHNTMPDRSPVFLQGDTSAGAVKQAASHRKHELGFEFLEYAKGELTRRHPPANKHFIHLVTPDEDYATSAVRPNAANIYFEPKRAAYG